MTTVSARSSISASARRAAAGSAFGRTRRRPSTSSPASGRKTATARISRSVKNFPICRDYLHTLRQMPEPTTAHRRRAAGGGNAARAIPRKRPARTPSSGGRPVRRSLPTPSRCWGNRAGLPPSPGRLLRASITSVAPSVRTSRRGSVLAAASHNSSSGVNSAAAGSNSTKYRTPSGARTPAPVRRRQAPRPTFRADRCGSPPAKRVAVRIPTETRGSAQLRLW